jgi:sugar lactone lactonase YvrE
MVNFICFHSINDLVAVSADTFYVTNFFYYHNIVPEVFLQFHWGSIVYYDGQDVRIVASGLNQPNGINRKGE